MSGAFRPGSRIVEAQLATQFGVSRGPLREAIRQLNDEGLLVTSDYSSTRVVSLDARDVKEIYSFRTALEYFAFQLIWDRRDDAFRRQLHNRHVKLLDAIESCIEERAIAAELHLHSLVYETTDHQILINSWKGLRGRLQLYWAAVHLAHNEHGPRPGAHEEYVDAAIGDDLERLRRVLSEHMQQGLADALTLLCERRGG
ncbi:MAG: GntR family transcriptional regulator [Rhizobiales bacterium]|nr:GntR family transcriptional regulator [Hyphomicrobiales bacterium]